MAPQDAGHFFDQYATLFDAIYGGGHSPWSRFINRRFRQSMWLRFQATLASCEPVAGKRILDVGCGPGHYVEALARAGAALVVGVDSAPAMIQLARERCTRAGVAERCQLVCAQFEGARFPDPFDHVVCMGFLEYVARPREIVGEIMQVCRRSALFSLPDRRGLLALQRRLRYTFRTPLFMYAREEVEALFHSVPEVAGFEVVPLARDFFVRARPAPGPVPAGGPRLDSTA